MDDLRAEAAPSRRRRRPYLRFTPLQRPGQRGGIQNAAPGGIDEDRMPTHPCQFFPTDHALRLLRQRAMQRHHVRAFQQFLQRYLFVNGRIRDRASAESQHPAPEGLPQRSDPSAYRTRANDAHGLSAQQVRHQAIFHAAVATSRLLPFYIAQQLNHKTDAQHRHGLRRVAGCVAHGDSPVLRLRYGDVIHPREGHVDELQGLRRLQHRRHVGQHDDLRVAATRNLNLCIRILRIGRKAVSHILQSARMPFNHHVGYAQSLQ